MFLTAADRQRQSTMYDFYYYIHLCLLKHLYVVQTSIDTETTTSTTSVKQPFPRTTWVSQHQKGKPFWILLEQKMMGRQWRRLDHVQIICTSLQTDNHASTSLLRKYMQNYSNISSNEIHVCLVLAVHDGELAMFQSTLLYILNNDKSTHLVGFCLSFSFVILGISFRLLTSHVCRVCNWTIFTLTNNHRRTN